MKNEAIVRISLACVALGVVVLVSIGLLTGGAAEAGVDETTVSTTTETILEIEASETTEVTESVEIEPTVILPEPTETIHIEETKTEPTPEPTINADSPSEPSSDHEFDVMKPSVNMDALEMLACVIYQEVGGDAYCDECRYRVADVVLNRIADSRFPNTMYEVLTQRAQYGRFHWTGIVWPERALWPGEQNAVNRAYRIAEDILNGNHSELYGQGYVWQAEFTQGSDGFWCCGHFFGR